MVEPMTDEELARLRAIAARGGRVPLGSCAKLLARLEQVETERDEAFDAGVKDGLDTAMGCLDRAGLTRAAEMIEDLIEEADAKAKWIGCQDSLCILEKPKGMQTNGGCRCDIPRGAQSRVRRAVKQARTEGVTEGLKEAGEFLVDFAHNAGLPDDPVKALVEAAELLGRRVR